MKSKHLSILGLSLLALWTNEAMAVKAKPGIVSYTEPDGSRLEIILHGDRFFNYATDASDNLLILNDAGQYEYAVRNAYGMPEASGMRAIQPPIAGMQRIKGSDYIKTYSVSMKRKSRPNSGSRSASGEAKYRYSSSAFPTVGEPHSLVILVEYPDYGFHSEDPKQYFEDFLNGDDFKADGASGSVRQYYQESSAGAFIPTFDLYGPVMMKNNRRYYGAGSELNANQMVVEAIEALDDEVDFSQYDHNDDGYVDSVYIIYADKGQADGGPAESVWPYSWELEEEGIFLEADGVKFNTYGMSNEYQSDNEMEGIGTFTHEFGHVLGLPDLYNTVNDYDTTTPNLWSLMDSGSYNNDSRTPPVLSSFERYSLGWIEPHEIIRSGEFSLPYLGTSNKAYIITTEEKPDEFFMAEYRSLEGWDRYLPASGMLVWHIDFVQQAWDDNVVNNMPSHQYVELERADNNRIAFSVYYQGDPFPGNMKVTEFSSTTTPALKSWAGRELNVTSLYNIREEEEMIKFNASLSEERLPSGIEDTETESAFIIAGDTVTAVSQALEIYDISGRRVCSAQPGDSVRLDKGIYVIGGKKIRI